MCVSQYCNSIYVPVLYGTDVSQCCMVQICPGIVKVQMCGMCPSVVMV